MAVVYILVPLAILIVMVAVIAFISSVRRGQFDDLDTPAWRMLIDDELDEAPPKKADEDSLDVPDTPENS